MKRAIVAVSVAILGLSACAIPERGTNRHVCLPDSGVCWLENAR